ncbi:hypothetical protein ACHAXT_009552 [Thalassiosira profunda]
MPSIPSPTSVGAVVHWDMTNTDEIVRRLERGEIEAKDVLVTVDEEVIIPPGCTDLPSALRHAQLQAQCLQVFKFAELKASVLAKVRGNSVFMYEKEYLAVYESITAHRDVWFNVLLRDECRASGTTAILGILCTIRRQRGDLRGCMKVMPAYLAVLEAYGKSIDRSEEDSLWNFKRLEMKANLIRLNCGAQLPDKAMAVKAFRDVVAFEREAKAAGRYLESDADMAEVMGVYIGHQRFHKVSDETIFNSLKVVFGSEESHEDTEAGNCGLKVCGLCDNEEKMQGDFNKCSRCHEQRYCSKQCQVKDWKAHKHLCKKNQLNVESDMLSWITKQLTSNYTKMVEVHSERPVSESQMISAKAGLAKLLKRMLAEDFKQYDTEMGIGDLPYDPAFSQALADYFAAQPGYEEVWRELRIGYKEKLEREMQEKMEKGEIIPSEEAIRHQAVQVALAFKQKMGSMFAEDGETDELMDPVRHNEFVDEIIELSKKFMREHPQFNSYDGLMNMANDPDYITELGVMLALRHFKVEVE